MGGGGGGGPPPLPKGFNDPWVPNARYEFGHTGANAYPQEDYYKKGGPYWPRGGVDENGNFVEGQYSHNPVGRYSRGIMDFIKSGGTVGGGNSQPSSSNSTTGPSGIEQWMSVVGARPEPAQPRPELMPGGYPLQHPATALQRIGGIQGGFRPTSTAANASGGFMYGETPTPFPDRYAKEGITPPGFTSGEYLRQVHPGNKWGLGHSGGAYSADGKDYYLLERPGVATRHHDGTIRVRGKIIGRDDYS